MFTQKTLYSCDGVLKHFQLFDGVIFWFSVCVKFSAARIVFWVNMGFYAMAEGTLKIGIFYNLRMRRRNT